MINTSGKSFADFQNRLDAKIAIIVKMTRGSSVWYLGDMEIDWGAIHIYALLTGCAGIKRAIDPFNKKWSVGEVTLSFSNLPFKVDSSGNRLRPSDDISVRETDPVEIYLLCGENASGLSDCILYFSGLLKEPPKLEENTWSITAVDRSPSLQNQMLPTKLVKSIYVDTPEDYRKDYIPLVYGSFDTLHAQTYGIDGKQLGLAKGIPINDEIPPDCVFSDHVLKSFSDLFWQPDSDFTIPLELSVGSRTLYTNSGGYGKATAIPGGGGLIKISPANSDWVNYSFASQVQTSFYPKAYDLEDITNHAMIKDNVSDNGTQMIGEGRWGFKQDKKIESLLSEIASGSGGSVSVYIEYKIDETATYSPLVYGFFYHGLNGGDSRWPYTDDSNNRLYADNTWRRLLIHDTEFKLKDEKDKQYLLTIKAVQSTGGNGSVGDQIILYVKELFLVILGRVPSRDYMWGEIEGRTFDSWIDGAGHSNSFNSGDLIEDPAYIIESLLRDELNWTTANIDEASFDAAANTSVIMRMNLTRKVTVAKIIRQICEQSTFAFHVSGAGKAKLIQLNESNPSTDRTIPFSHIKANTLRITMVGPFCNSLHYSSCWLPQLQKYRDIDSAENIGSQNNYSVHELPVYWPNIEGASVAHIKGVLLDGAGLWCVPKRAIEFETVRFTNTDIEIGDWVELDDETWDAQLKQMGGVSWSGEQFLVTEVTQKQDGTRIKAIAI
jgi:hypothetical protein